MMQPCMLMRSMQCYIKNPNLICEGMLIRRKSSAPAGPESMVRLVLPQLSNIICSICFMSASEEPFTHFDSWKEVRQWYSRKEINI